MDPGQTPTRTPKVIKRGGIHYTRQDLGGFLANQALKLASKGRVRVLDPACGDGSLLEAVAREAGGREVHLCGLDTDPDAVKGAIARLRRYTGGRVSFEVQQADFVEEILATHQGVSRLFGPEHASGPVANPFDVVIANPPYVRTQVLGSAVSRNLATDFGLSGRVDLYHAFVVGMALALRDGGVLSLLCSNRFMTTRSGSDLRRILASQFQIQHLYDLGDTKLFSAAVLPAIVLATRSTGKTQEFEMTSIYELKSAAGSCQPAASVVEALKDGRTSPISVGGRSFGMRNGRVRVDTWDKPWVAPSEGGSEILEGLAARTCMRFQDVARVRVGIK